MPHYPEGKHISLGIYVRGHTYPGETHITVTLVHFVIKFLVFNKFSLSINTQTGDYGRPTAAI